MKILSNIQTVKDTVPLLRMSLYGPSGAGKTVLAATAPRPLFLDTEDGSESLRNHDWSKESLRHRVKNSDDIIEFVQEARANTEMLTDMCETIVVDTLTELSAKDLSKTLLEKNQKDSSRNPYAAQQIDYKENTERLRRIIIALFDLPVHVILISHDRDIKDDGDGRIYIRPALSPKLGETVKGLVSVQGYLKAQTERDGEVRRFLQLQPANQVDAKCRVGGLPAIIEDPNLEMIFKAKNAQENDNE